MLGEALVIALMGTILGMILAVAGLRAITIAPTARGFINPNLPPEVLLIALAMGVGLSLARWPLPRGQGGRPRTH